jgi:hypothetical protein
LAGIILNEFYPFYQHWEGAECKDPTALIEHNFAAHHLWSRGLVFGLGRHKYNVVEKPWVYFFMEVLIFTHPMALGLIIRPFEPSSWTRNSLNVPVNHSSGLGKDARTLLPCAWKFPKGR